MTIRSAFNGQILSDADLAIICDYATAQAEYDRLPFCAWAA